MDTQIILDPWVVITTGILLAIGWRIGTAAWEAWVMVVAWATKKITSRSMKDMETNG
jgi:hypothetical protein